MPARQRKHSGFTPKGLGGVVTLGSAGELGSVQSTNSSMGWSRDCQTRAAPSVFIEVSQRMRWSVLRVDGCVGTGVGYHVALCVASGAA